MSKLASAALILVTLSACATLEERRVSWKQECRTLGLVEPTDIAYCTMQKEQMHNQALTDLGNQLQAQQQARELQQRRAAPRQPHRYVIQRFGNGFIVNGY